MTINKTQPIGIFDSGIGGLTVTKAVVNLLPRESLVYFGDTARVPYGDKSAATIKNYAMQIVDFLLGQNCKMILIACNSIAAAAYDEIKKHVGDRALLINVIDPLVAHLAQNYTHKTIGLIGTEQTVKSGVYQRKLTDLRVAIKLRTLATPLLVPIIEAGFVQHKLIDVALEEYLSRKALANIDALILGCTHYPVIKRSIDDYYKSAVEIIDAASIVAREVARQLERHEMLHDGAVRTMGERLFYVSDYTDAFAENARQFFGDNIKLCHRPW